MTNAIDPKHANPEALAAYPHTLALPVLWNDMDAMNHVNNTVYFRYLESGRIEFLRTYADEFAMPGANDVERGIALAETRCRFKVPLTYPDTIVVGSGVREIGEHHFILQQEIYSTQLGFVAAEGDGRMVYYDYINQCKAKIEGDFLARLQSNLIA